MTSVPTHGGVVAQHSSEANLVLARGAEKRLMHRIIIGVAIAVPVCTGLWVGLIVLAVRHSTHTAGVIAMAVGIGVLNGLFFGTWAAFVATTHTFEELDHMPDTTASELWTAVEGESDRRSETQDPDVVGGQR
jgi:hypothetical protein